MKKVSVILLTFLLSGFVLAQEVKKTDTLKQDTAAVDKTAQLLRKMDSTRVADSLRKVALLKEIENLKGTEANKQREELLKRLKKQEQDDSVRKASQLAQLQKLKESAKGHPVIFSGDTLFYVYTKIGSFSAADRAAAIGTKIKNLYKDNTFAPDSLSVTKTELATEIGYQDIVVMSINELEAMWHDRTPEALANEYRTLIVDAIKAERKAYSIINILLRIGAIILILISIYFLIRLVNKLFVYLRKKARELKDSILKGVRFRGYQFLDSERELQVLLFILKILRLTIIVLVFYITLPLLFSVFPWTQGIANTLWGWVTTPLGIVFTGFIKYLPNLFTILVIGTVTYYVAQFLNFVAKEIESGALTLPGFYPDWARPTLNIVKVLLYAFSFIVIFPYLPGSQSPIFQGVSVFLGLLVSLGSSSAISNAVAGLVITYMRPFKIGDRIKIGELTGDVMEKSVLVTRIRTIKNEDITIPNATILSGHTINYTTSAKERGLILYTGVTIGYDVPWKQVHELLINAALTTKGILKDENRKPFVLQTSLDDFYVAYQINAYTEESHRMAAIYSELHQNIQDKFNEAGVEILSPHYRAERDGNMITIPANYLPKDYKAPSFNVTINKTDEAK